MQPDLFHNSQSYPRNPGFRKIDTSVKAATTMRNSAPVVRERVLGCLKAYSNGLTTEEISQKLGIPYATIQPRTSELRKIDAIRDSQKRRKNASGRVAIVWQHTQFIHDKCEEETAC